MMTRILALFSILLMLAGCAAGPEPMPPETSDQFRISNIAIAYSYPDKAINYSEDVYKVLWIEKRGNGVSFEGLWDIDKDLSAFYNQKMTNLGLNTTSVFDTLTPAQKESFYLKMAVNHNKDGLIDSIKIDEESRKALLQNNQDYLVIFYQAPLHLQVHDWFNNIFIQSATRVEVIDLKDNSEAFSTFEYLFHVHKYVEQPREIESNNLAGFKAMLKDAIEKQFHEKRLAAQLNM